MDLILLMHIAMGNRAGEPASREQRAEQLNTEQRLLQFQGTGLMIHSNHLSQIFNSMSDSELEHLKKMANQIAVNFSFHDDQVARIADHLTRFWAPSMRNLLGTHIEAGGAGVDEVVRQAMKDIARA